MKKETKKRKSVHDRLDLLQERGGGEAGGRLDSVLYWLDKFDDQSSSDTCVQSGTEQTVPRTGPDSTICK